MADWLSARLACGACRVRFPQVPNIFALFCKLCSRFPFVVGSQELILRVAVGVQNDGDGVEVLTPHHHLGRRLSPSSMQFRLTKYWALRSGVLVGGENDDADASPLRLLHHRGHRLQVLHLRIF